MKLKEIYLEGLRTTGYYLLFGLVLGILCIPVRLVTLFLDHIPAGIYYTLVAAIYIVFFPFIAYAASSVTGFKPISKTEALKHWKC